MTGALFLAHLDNPQVGDQVMVEGDEARHATVKRVEVGEHVLVADGKGLGIEGSVVDSTKSTLTVTVEAVRREEPRRRVTAVQALAKGDRSTLAVQMLTEMGASRIVAWQADRSIVRWPAERRDKALAKWEATARESSKQSRRFSIPEMSFAMTKQLPDVLSDVSTVLVLHEDASQHIRDVAVEGDVAVVVGPEGGIAPDELDVLVAAGAQPVRIADHVLRTSTAGAVALGQLELL